MNKNKIKSILKLAFAAGRLKSIVRTGWQKKGVKKPESVADHSYRAAILAMLLAPQLGLDQSKTVKMALIHDLGEGVIGDIIWEKGKKVIGSKKDKDIYERKAIEDIFNDYKNSKEYIELWKEFEEQSSDEAKLLKQIDKLEMAIQAYEYEQQGYDAQKLEEFWDNASKYLKGTQLEPLFKDLLKMQKNN